jgi:hypothetical protein
VLLANKMVVRPGWTVRSSIFVRTAKEGIFNLYALDGKKSSKAQVEIGK